MIDTNEPSYELLQFVVERVNVGVFIIDRQYNVCYWNTFMATHSAKSASHVVGKNLFETFPDLPERWFKKKIDSVFVIKSYAFTTWEYRNHLFKFKSTRPITGGVEYMYQNLTLIPIKQSDSVVEQVMVLVRDSTDEAFYAAKLHDAMAKLEHISQIDGLTNLFNRLHWEQRLAEEFARARRHGSTFSLMMLDVDHFKRVNDQYGHLAGDDVLRRVADVLRDSLRQCDVAGRYGGEEFGVLLTETPIEGAVIAADRLRRCIEDMVLEYNGQQLRVTISVGIARYHSDMANPECLIARADEALYESKQLGRNCVSVCKADRGEIG